MQNMNLDPQLIARKHRLQATAMAKEGDYKKNEQRKAQLDMQIRQNKRKIDLLIMEMDRDKLELNKLNVTQLMMANEIKKTKKQIAEMK